MSLIFCRFHVGLFSWQNSSIKGMKAFVTVTSARRNLTHFPGANQIADTCPCGATKSCQDPTLRYFQCYLFMYLFVSFLSLFSSRISVLFLFGFLPADRGECLKRERERKKKKGKKIAAVYSCKFATASRQPLFQGFRSAHRLSCHEPLDCSTRAGSALI